MSQHYIGVENALAPDALCNEDPWADSAVMMILGTEITLQCGSSSAILRNALVLLHSEHVPFLLKDLLAIGRVVDRIIAFETAIRTGEYYKDYRIKRLIWSDQQGLTLDSTLGFGVRPLRILLSQHMAHLRSMFMVALYYQEQSSSYA